MTLCILHLGSEKTGTSSIQKYFSLHRQALLREPTYWPALNAARELCNV